MYTEKFKNNKVEIMGKVTKSLTFSHELCGESFYESEITVSRLSGVEDKIPVLISDRIIDIGKDYTGKTVFITGEFRSFNAEGGKLILNVFVHEIEVFDNFDGGDLNTVALNGYLCKKPTYRKTPLGREIADVLLAVNRSYGKSDYIPCVCWGRNALFVSNFETGARIYMEGRIQSRVYKKTLSDTEIEERTAYEVSVATIREEM